jgi:hypothetical protein
MRLTVLEQYARGVAHHDETAGAKMHLRHCGAIDSEIQAKINDVGYYAVERRPPFIREPSPPLTPD